MTTPKDLQALVKEKIQGLHFLPRTQIDLKLLTIPIEVDGVVRIFDVKVVEVGTFQGLEISGPEALP